MPVSSNLNWIQSDRNEHNASIENAETLTGLFRDYRTGLVVTLRMDTGGNLILEVKSKNGSTLRFRYDDSLYTAFIDGTGFEEIHQSTTRNGKRSKPRTAITLKGL